MLLLPKQTKLSRAVAVAFVVGFVLGLVSSACANACAITRMLI